MTFVDQLPFRDFNIIHRKSETGRKYCVTSCYLPLTEKYHLFSVVH